MDIIKIKIEKYDKGRNLVMLLNWLRTGLRVITDDHYEVEINGDNTDRR